MVGAGKAEKFCSFIEEAGHQGRAAPGAKYNLNYQRLDPKDKAPMIWKEGEQEAKTNRLLGIKKDDMGIAPCDYRVMESFKATIPDDKVGTQFGKEQLENFTEKIKRTKKFIPGVGQYNLDVQ